MALDKVLLSLVAQTPIDEAIPSEQLNLALSSHPFVVLPGSINIRDIGLFAPEYIKPNVIFRSGTLDFMPETSLSVLHSQHGISKIYDFRRKDEVKQLRCQIYGIDMISCPYKDDTESPKPTIVSDFAPVEGQDFCLGYRLMYDDILDGYTTGYRKVFEALRDARQGNAILFHCTAGKDRTGVMAALILDLMGAPAELIGEEYALTRIGTEPFRKELLPWAIKSLTELEGNSDWQANVSVDEQVKALSLSSPGVLPMFGMSTAVMVDFVERLRNKYCGAEGYMKQKLGFSDDEIRDIRKNLRPDQV